MPKWVERIPVDSETSDATYIVGISAEGEFACSCPHWKFRRLPCKHIAGVKAERSGQAKVAMKKSDSKKVMDHFSDKPDFTARPRRMIQLEDD